MKVKKLTSLIIETTNACNLNCRICPTNNEMKRKKGYMSFELFQKTIDGGKSLEHLCLHNWGEPIQNKYLFEMIRYAHDKGISYTVFNTNGTLLDETITSGILNSPLSILRISVDGNPDTYKHIRGIDFKIIEKNILNLLKKRDKTGSTLKIGIVMVVDEHTEKDIKRQVAATKRSYRSSEQTENSSQKEKLLRCNSIDSFYDKWSAIVDHVHFQPKLITSQRTGFCPEPFGKDYGKMTVLWDGRVIPCCADYEGELQIGNILNEAVDSIWNGLAIKRLRKKHLNKDFPDTCKNCSEYESERAEKRFVVR